jgi:hypothetical protein
MEWRPSGHRTWATNSDGNRRGRTKDPRDDEETTANAGSYRRRASVAASRHIANTRQAGTINAQILAARHGRLHPLLQRAAPPPATEET